jgi:hypothetical protein
MAIRKTRQATTSSGNEIPGEARDAAAGGIEDTEAETELSDAVGRISGRIPGYGEYEIVVEEVLRQSLPGAFGKVDEAPLTLEATAKLPIGAKGAYLLFMNGRPVYAGKTDTRHGFQARLRRHALSVQHREGLDPSHLTFKTMRIMVFSAFDVESILIREMQRLDPAHLNWNNNGFGSNDPGQNRDDGEPSNFEKEFPINVDVVLSDIPAGPMALFAVLKRAQHSVSYKLRHGPITGYAQVTVLVPKNPTMQHILDAVAGVLPDDFQITIFHGRIILYSQEKIYKYARKVIRGRA